MIKNLLCAALSLLCLVSPAIPQETTPPKGVPAPPVEETNLPPGGEPLRGEPVPEKYVVKAGDNPWKIAKDHGIELEALLKANQIRDARKLNIGDVLVLPAGTPSKGAPPAAPESKAPETPPAASPTSGDDWELYTIQKGDNPWNIAKRLKVNHQKILSLNEGTNFRKLMIGQQIKVPKK